MVKRPRTIADDVPVDKRWRMAAARFVFQFHFDPKILIAKLPAGSRYSIAHECGSHVHTDAYVVFPFSVDWTTLKPVQVQGKLPSCFPNKARGQAFKTACDRGMFYNQCEGKLGNTSLHANWRACEDFVVKTVWIQDLWQQGKLPDPIRAAARYNCLTPALEQMYKRTMAHRMAQARAEFLENRARALENRITPFVEVPDFRQWQHQYDETRFRYRFLWMWSYISQLGKTEFIKFHYPNAFFHENSVSWEGYDPLRHEAIVFDDLANPTEFILHNKKLFQASCRVRQGTSATNMYAVEVDVVAKPIIVLANFPPGTSQWISANCEVIQVLDKLYTDVF